MDDLPFYLQRRTYETKGTPGKSTYKKRPSLKDVQGEAERKALLHALDSTDNNKKKAAELLGIHRTLLYKKMKKYNIPIYKNGESTHV